MIKQKKSNLAYYIIAILVIAAVGFVVMHEVPLSSQHVEEEVRLTE